MMTDKIRILGIDPGTINLAYYYGKYYKNRPPKKIRHRLVNILGKGHSMHEFSNRQRLEKFHSWIKKNIAMFHDADEIHVEIPPGKFAPHKYYVQDLEALARHYNWKLITVSSRKLRKHFNYPQFTRYRDYKNYAIALCSDYWNEQPNKPKKLDDLSEAKLYADMAADRARFIIKA